MNFQQKIILGQLLTFVLGGAAFAQVVDIPDPNLRAAIADTLNIAHDAPITQDDMNRLTDLDVQDHGIASLTGLESASNLISLVIADSPITDLRPIAGLAQLERLYMWSIPRLDITPLANLTNLRTLAIAACDIDDISPLATLTHLTNLNVRFNRIVDVSPIAHLAELAVLRLNGNRIVDVSPLAHLTKLESLDIRDNHIKNHDSLDGLTLVEFLFDEICELAPYSVNDRIKNRDYPSIVSRWSGPSWPSILNRPELTGIENLASHDLWYSVPMFGLGFEYGPEEIKLVGNLDEAIRRREEYLSINPNMVFLVQVRMRSGGTLSYLPEDSPYWIRDAEGNIAEEGLIDFTHPYIQDRIVQQAIAVSKCGLYDGIFFDWWNEHDAVLAHQFGDWSHKFRGYEAEQRARDNVLRRIRAETRPDFLIMGNTNYSIIPRTGPYINGGFMETSVPRSSSGAQLEELLSQVENSLLWLDQNLREPRINSLEGQVVPTESLDSPTNRRWMRALTTLSLTHSDGYVVFTSDFHDFRHNWYVFWDADLGRPLGVKAQLYDEETPGLYIREFTNGWAVYNNSGAPQVITLPEQAQGVASRVADTRHTLPNLDGEMYLRVTPVNPADLNGDGIVNILDLILVAQGLGTNETEVDVNADGVVNVFDLVFVANQF